MVEELYRIKNLFLEKMQNDIDERGGIERVNVDEMYKLADIVKDLAEAEKACWEAEYYRSVTEAMEGESGYPNQSGYPQGGSRGNQGGSGYAQGGSGYPGGQGGRSGGQGGSQRSGWANQYGRGRSRRGYGMGYPMEELKREMQQADPQERERMVQELREMMNGQM